MSHRNLNFLVNTAGQYDNTENLNVSFKETKPNAVRAILCTTGKQILQRHRQEILILGKDVLLMLKKIMLIMMATAMLLLTAGCSDEFKGDWMRTIRNGDETRFHILHLSKADGGGYVLEQEFKTFKKTDVKGYNDVPYSLLRMGTPNFDNAKTKGGEGILNTKEVINWKPIGFGNWLQPNWTGTKLKLLRQYKYDEAKVSDVYQFKKEELAINNGRLLLGNKLYEKTDKAKVDKMVTDYKESLKKLIGTEVDTEVPNLKPNQVKGVITKIVIATDGQKEEVFE